MLFIFCDRHKTRVPVTDFARVDGQWREIGRDSRVRIAKTESGLGIVLTGSVNRRTDTYWLYDLKYDRWPRCRRNVRAQEENLFPALDGFKAAGLTELPLLLLGLNPWMIGGNDRRVNSENAS